MPVKLLLGRAMLLTRPSFTGSWLAMKTMGIVVVAALTAKGPRVHRGRATELNSRQFGVLCAEARPQCGLDFSTARLSSTASTARVRVRLLRELAANRESLVATHLSFPSVCHVAVDGDVFRWVPGPWEY